MGMRLGHVLKRALDVSAAAGGLVALSPALAAIAVAIKLDSPGTVFFVQERLGKDGKPFRMFKFRTMRDAPIRYNPDGSTTIDPNDDRVTRVGKLLRGSLDELPQLLNILRGEMSIVGPRPDMASQRHLYVGDEVRKLEVLPGLTSLAVVSGRNDIPWKQRIQLDLKYIDRWSLGLDLKIIIETLAMAVGRRAVDFTDVVA